MIDVRSKHVLEIQNCCLISKMYHQSASSTINCSFHADGDVGIEGGGGSDGKGEWSEMVRACVEEG